MCTEILYSLLHRGRSYFGRSYSPPAQVWDSFLNRRLYDTDTYFALTHIMKSITSFLDGSYVIEVVYLTTSSSPRQPWKSVFRRGCQRQEPLCCESPLVLGITRWEDDPYHLACLLLYSKRALPTHIQGGYVRRQWRRGSLYTWTPFVLSSLYKVTFQQKDFFVKNILSFKCSNRLTKNLWAGEK